MGKVRSGSIHKTKSGKWLARYSAPDGTQVRQGVPDQGRTATRGCRPGATPTSRRAGGSSRKSDALATVTFADYAERWLANRKVKGRPLAERTRERLPRSARPVHPPDLRPPAGAHDHPRRGGEVVRPHRRRTRPTYRARAYSLLRTILASAVDDGYLAVNPARIRGAGSVKRAHKVRPATLDELEALTEAMPPRYRLMVLLAAWCALRFGELTELRRGDVDTQRGRAAGPPRRGPGRRRVHGQGAEVRGRGPRRGDPAALMPMVREHLLRSHRARAGRAAVPLAERPDPAPAPVRARPGCSTRPGKAAGRPDLRFHDLRHTGAVLAAQTGATLAELMGRLGHSTPGAAMRYQHAAADRDALIASRLSERDRGPLSRRLTTTHPTGGPGDADAPRPWTPRGPRCQTTT